MPPFLLYTKEQSDELEALTEDREWKIAPVFIPSGPHAGKYAASPSIATSDYFTDIRDKITVVSPVLVNISLAWPQEE